ncbi:MAG TPA: sodium/proton-translocating pyrophosphatase, partial [Candidatus Omnitrophota bacterium]|nr:sodium/proton-translocating pyrophosphatase [Candidatus Omnitrophota bacterium]
MSNFIIPLVGVLGLVFAMWTFRSLMKISQGSAVMEEIANEVHKGAMVFLKREYSIILVFVIVMFAVISVFLSLSTGFAYVSGAFCSMLAGFIGMKAATRSSARTCEAARSMGAGEALAVA